MPSVIHGADDLSTLLEAPSATENGSTQAPYGICQHMTIVEEEREKDGGLGACPRKDLELRPLERPKHPYGTWCEGCYHN